MSLHPRKSIASDRHRLRRGVMSGHSICHAMRTAATDSSGSQAPWSAAVREKTARPTEDPRERLITQSTDYSINSS